MASGWHRKQKTEADRERQRKYDSAEHRAAKAHYRTLIEYGLGRCWRCSQPIPPGSRWHVGHDDTNVNIIRGAEHFTCNVKAGARKGARLVNAKRKAARQAAAFTRPIR